MPANIVDYGRNLDELHYIGRANASLVCTRKNERQEKRIDREIYLCVNSSICCPNFSDAIGRT